MDTPRLVALLLPFVWVAWTAAMALLATVVIRRDLLPHAPQRRVLWIVIVAAAGAFAATFVLPARIDASGLLELSGGNEPWKGAAGEALLQVLGVVRPLSLPGIIYFTRACVLPTCILAVLVIAQQPAGSSSWTRAGLDLRWLLVALVLLATPSFLYGTLGVFNFWFFCMVSLAMLLAWQDIVRASTWPGRIALVSSVLLIGFARPETIVGGVAMAALVAAFALRRKDFRLLIPAALALLLLIVVAPSVLSYLGDRMRNQPLLTGADATGDASLWMLPWVAARRIVVHAPLNLLALLIALHAIGVLAVVRAVRMVRSRSASWPEMAALALIVAEFLAIGVHRAGFTRYIKYGQLVIVPCWYLASRVWFARPVDRRLRTALLGSAVAALVVMCASLMLTGPGFNRCSLAVGRTLSARRSDEVLLWNTAPRWARSLCSTSFDRRAVRVLVVGLDDRVPNKGVGIEDAFSKPSCEPERWPIERILDQGGCGAMAVYPDARDSVGDALFDPGRGALCRAIAFGNLAGEPQPATHAIVSYYGAQRPEEIRVAIAQHPSCPWEIVEIAESAMLLRRSGQRTQPAAPSAQPPGPGFARPVP